MILKKECEFEEELLVADFFVGDPKITPPATVSSLSTARAGSISTDKEEELPLAKAVSTNKRKRRSKSSATEIRSF